MNHILGVQVYQSNKTPETKWMSQFLFVFVILVGISKLPSIKIVPIILLPEIFESACAPEPDPGVYQIFQFLFSGLMENRHSTSFYDEKD